MSNEEAETVEIGRLLEHDVHAVLCRVTNVGRANGNTANPLLFYGVCTPFVDLHNHRVVGYQDRAANWLLPLLVQINNPNCLPRPA